LRKKRNLSLRGGTGEGTEAAGEEDEKGWQRSISSKKRLLFGMNGCDYKNRNWDWTDKGQDYFGQDDKKKER